VDHIFKHLGEPHIAVAAVDAGVQIMRVGGGGSCCMRAGRTSGVQWR
jgi:hypothetical protein